MLNQIAGRIVLLKPSYNTIRRTVMNNEEKLNELKQYRGELAFRFCTRSDFIVGRYDLIELTEEELDAEYEDYCHQFETELADVDRQIAELEAAV